MSQPGMLILRILLPMGCMILQSCPQQRHEWNRPLIGGYSVSYYEFYPEDAFFLVDRNHSTAVPPQLLKIGNDDRYIFGRTKWSGDRAFSPFPSGFFVIDTNERSIVAQGLSDDIFTKEFPTLAEQTSIQPAEMWKQLRGVYKPGQNPHER